MRDDDYYRACKKRLMDEIKDRFGTVLRARRRDHGEERFEAQETSEYIACLVKECLIRFTPWQSMCVLPSQFDPKRNLTPSLLFEGGDPDKEHEIELNRIHTLIHPTCLERVTTALGMDAPVLSCIASTSS